MTQSTRNMDLTLKEKFVLLAMHPRKGTNLIPTFIGHGIAGALLLELAGLGKIRISDKRISLIDAKKTGDPRLDYLIEMLQQAGKPLKVKNLITKLQGKSSKIRRPLIAGLVRKRYLHEEHKRFLIIPYKRYPSANRKYRDDMIEQIRRLVLRKVESDSDIALLTGLVGATRLFTKFFHTRDERMLAKKRIKEIVKDSAVDQAIDETVKAVQAAVAVSIATTAVVTSSSH